MVTVCQMCGDKGFSVALIYCDKCQTYAIHRYCLYKFPKTFEEYVVWFCADCDPNVQRQSSPSLKLPENLEKDESQRKLPVVVGPSSNEEDKLVEAKTPPDICTHSMGSDWVNIDEGVDSFDNKTSLAAIDENLSIINNILDTGRRELDRVCSDEAAECANAKTSVVTTSNQRVCSDEAADCVNTKTSIVAASNQIPKHSYVPARPIFEPTWWGCFRLYDENLTVGAIAHLSSLACLKVCETAERLPEFLRLDLLPRCDVWPKGFKISGPSEESIALYFFPNDERETKTFEGIVDKMISQDLGMRAVVKDVELLVYTSNILPQHCWKFQEKYYLWGVFRAKQTSHLTNVVRGEEKNLMKASTWDSRSPISPLSDTGSSRSS
ncbi:hypothetical protein PTKIN_Ptkin01aG0009600 [Pterospermum kingtungense]